ncbi:uncharacterized protein LOC111713519 isoform X2 [Eurytemora carolleeae]|uniref:uncharacterized protein LOC111713519 isoform X2 n=1 Tax=Eurytemora carolleeae TaxID=1294199 RepID=UPI000C775A76|nr:uncharacterized protein LOC111713519 isoform X2 [Eurytemora carolleeae]|eukprot:XP_023344160.1 uncharacterized protein LOC111713519 isoform X2 [Eurytemora affinis]
MFKMMLGNLITRSYNCHVRIQGWILLPNFCHLTLSSILCRAYSSKYSHFYRILELPDNSDKESVRRKYIELVKLYHPDITSDLTDKFSEIDSAFKSLQRKFKEDEMREEQSSGEYGLYYKEKVEDEEEHKYPEKDHIAPQHRQYCF